MPPVPGEEETELQCPVPRAGVHSIIKGPFSPALLLQLSLEQRVRTAEALAQSRALSVLTLSTPRSTVPGPGTFLPDVGVCGVFSVFPGLFLLQFLVLECFSLLSRSGELESVTEAENGPLSSPHLCWPSPRPPSALCLHVEWLG